MTETDKILSPCVRNCCLNEQDVCLGCFRHLDEIVNWSARTEAEKGEVLQRCEERKRESGYV